MKLSTKMMLVLPVLLFLLRATASSLNETQELRTNETQVQTTDRRNSVTIPSNSTLYLLVLLPYPDLTGGPSPSWSGGPNVLPAIEMAMEDINRKPNILPGYKLDLIHGNSSGCNITDKTTTSFVRGVFYQEGKHPVGIIGPGCSASTLHIAPLAGRDDVALISAHGASTPKLEDRTKYPYVFGGFTSLKVYAKAIVGFLKERNWTRVAVLYDNSRVFHKTAFTEINEALANESNLNITFASGIYPHFLPVDQIKENFLRVTIVLAGPKVVRKILCLSYHQGLRFPSHQFLIIERHLPEIIESIDFMHKQQRYNCSKETMFLIMEGNLLTEYKVSPLDKNSTSTINGTSYDQFMTEYKGRIQQLQQTMSYPHRESIMESIWGALWYDMVWAMAMALNNAELYEGVDLQTYGLGMKNITSKIYRQFRDLDFNGTSGRIVFSDNSTFVHRKVDVYQVNNSELVNVAVIDGSEVTTLNNGTYTNAEYMYLTKVYCLHTAATVMVLFIVSVILVALLITHVVTVKFRHNTVVKGSSPRLQHLAYAGCYLLIVATLTLFAPKAFKLSNGVHLAFCHIMNVCFSCGYTLITGTVCAKTWRLYRIFCHYQKPGKMLADHWLFAIILTLTLVDVVANIVWATTDHFVIENRTLSINNDSNNNTVTTVIETVCNSHNRIAWTSAIICYNVGILIAAVWLAILTRKVHIPQFQTKTVVILAYMLFLLFGLGVPLKLILDKPYLWIAMFLLTVLLCLFLLFLPPLLPTLAKKKYGRRVHAQASKTSIITLFSHPV